MPVNRQESGGRQIACRNDGTRWCGYTSNAGPELRQDPIADVLQVGGAGAEIRIIGRRIAGDFRVHRCFPGSIRGRTAGDGNAGRRHQLVVLQHRDLEGDDLRSLGVHPRLQRSCVG